MIDSKQPITFGSIIHLKNEFKNGGYLATNGWLSEEKDSKVDDSRLRMSVSTYANANQLQGSVSWQILSAAQEKSDGEPVTRGDQIYLRSMSSGAGYLNSFSQDGASSREVLTAVAPLRSSRLSGVWTVQLTSSNQDRQFLYEGDLITLKNNEPEKNVLQTGNKEKSVTTGSLDEMSTEGATGESSHVWKIELAQISLYRVQNRWGDEGAPWHEAGIFKIGSVSGNPVTSLNLTLENDSKNLTGQVRHDGDYNLHTITAIPQEQQNLYKIDIQKNKSPITDSWWLGSRETQPLVALDVRSDDNGDTLIGEMRYAAEPSIAVKMVWLKNQHNNLLHAFFHPGLFRRDSKIEGMIDTTYKLLSNSFAEMSPNSLDEFIRINQFIEKILNLQASIQSLELPAKRKKHIAQQLKEIFQSLHNLRSSMHHLHIPSEGESILKQLNALYSKLETNKNVAELQAQAPSIPPQAASLEEDESQTGERVSQYIVSPREQIPTEIIVEYTDPLRQKIFYVDEPFAQQLYDAFDAISNLIKSIPKLGNQIEAKRQKEEQIKQVKAQLEEAIKSCPTNRPIELPIDEERESSREEEIQAQKQAQKQIDALFKEIYELEVDISALHEPIQDEGLFERQIDVAYRSLLALDKDIQYERISSEDGSQIKHQIKDAIATINTTATQTLKQEYKSRRQIKDNYDKIRELQKATDGLKIAEEEKALLRRLDVVYGDSQSDVHDPNALVDLIDHEFQIKQLLNLHTFSVTLNAFFQGNLQDLITQSLENHRLHRTPAPLHLIRDCLRHVAADHEIIQRATTQRRWNCSNNDKPFMSQQAKELLIMDKLAIRALAPFRHLLTDQPEHLAIITYLSERTHIHHVPYANQFILIGVSYDRLPPIDSLFDDSEFATNFHGYELMAIPHEVGHHVFQQGKLKDGRTFAEVSKQFATNPYYHWCEEIFADVYGCVVGGPLAALGMQAYLVSIDRKRAWKDDDHHPTPVLRVFLLAEILRILTKINPTKKADSEKGQKGANYYQFTEITKTLNQNWAKILEKWGYEQMEAAESKKSYRPHRMYLHDESELHLDRVVNVERVVKAIRPIIFEFAYLLLDAAESTTIDPTNKDRLLATDIPWSQTDYTTFANYNLEMAQLTKRPFARKKVIHETLLVESREKFVQPDEDNPDELLQHYLERWHYDGPVGSSAGAH
ncbi:MAG: hypothetical protein AAF614_01675 [Chloroflexota bacterium]